MVCRQCGRTLPDQAKFCIGCGLPTQQAPTPQPPVAPIPPVRQSYVPTPETPSAALPRDTSYGGPEDQRPEDRSFQPGGPAPFSRQTGFQAQPYYGRPRQQDPAWARRGYDPARTASTFSPEPEPEQLVESRAPGRRSGYVPVGLRVLSVFLCILLVCSGLAATAIGALRWSYNSGQVKDTVNALDLRKIEIPMEDGTVLSLIPFLENQAGIDLEQDYGISDRQVDTVMDQPFVKDFVGDVISDYTDYLFFGASLNALSRNRVVDFFRENDQEIERYTGFSFREHEHDLSYGVGNYLEHYDLDALFDNSLHARELSEDYLREKTGVNLDLIRSLLSTWIPIASLALVLLFLILIFLTLLRSPRSALTGIGISFAVIGVLDLLASLGLRIWLNTQHIHLTSIFLRPFSSKLAIIGVLTLVLGVVLILLRVLLRKPVEEEL